MWHAHTKRAEVRMVANGGRAEAPPTAERLRPWARRILTKGALHEIVEQDPQWRVLEIWPFGALYGLAAVWKRRGIPAVISEPLASRPVDFAVACARLAMVAKRACAPSAKSR